MFLLISMFIVFAVTYFAWVAYFDRGEFRGSVIPATLAILGVFLIIGVACPFIAMLSGPTITETKVIKGDILSFTNNEGNEKYSFTTEDDWNYRVSSGAVMGSTDGDSTITVENQVSADWDFLPWTWDDEYKEYQLKLNPDDVVKP